VSDRTCTATSAMPVPKVTPQPGVTELSASMKPILHS
jgi:hypothetical protein